MNTLIANYQNGNLCTARHAATRHSFPALLVALQAAGYGPGAAIAIALLSLGAEKYVHDPAAKWRAEVPGYRFQTCHGLLELHPSLPIRLFNGRRTAYDLTVFGRFPDAQRAAESLGHWKWNHHFGYRSLEEIEFCIAHLAQGLSRMLTPSLTKP